VSISIIGCSVGEALAKKTGRVLLESMHKIACLRSILESLVSLSQPVSWVTNVTVTAPSVPSLLQPAASRILLDKSRVIFSCILEGTINHGIRFNNQL
jgi:hypothetical protein